jgi:hypothetical protein
MTAFGPKRTFLAASHMSAFGSKADIVVLCHHTARRILRNNLVGQL